MKTEERIYSPTIGTVVKCHAEGKNYPCDVLITEGQFMSNNRVSNFWYWRRILKNGKLGKIESGYGVFTKTENKYKIETIVTPL